MPELSDDLERRLAALATDGPVALPGAAAARRRGAQRSRRTTAALAGGGAAAVVAAVVLLGAVDGGGPDRVTIPATSPAPAPEGEVAGLGLFERLLTQDAVAQVLPGPWSLQLETDVAPEVPVFPCGAGPAPPASGDGRVTTGVRLGVEDGRGATVVRQAVEQYTGPTTAARAYDRVRDRVTACPDQSLPDVGGPGTVVTEVVDAGPELDDGVRTLLVRSASPCRDCPPETAWFAVQQAGDVLSALRVDGVEGGGVAAVEPFAELVAERLRRPG